MPFYQFTVPANSLDPATKQEIATAVTDVHCRVTGAPAHYVNCQFVEVPTGNLFVGGGQRDAVRMVGIIRRGRSEEVRRQLLMGIAEAWSTASGDDLKSAAMFLVEIPGFQAMENGEILKEAWEDLANGTSDSAPAEESQPHSPVR
jgi:phenylpyruvate tautomerase PptA (4-oxalocrotonate tautomerase family)